MILSCKTIGTCLAERARHTPDEISIIYEDVSYTWNELDKISDYMAYRMHTFGITQGTHVGIWSVNNPNWIIVFLSLQKLGALPILINTCYREKELREILHIANVEYLYYGDVYKDIHYPDIVETIKKENTSNIKKWLFIGKDRTGSWLNFNSFVSSEKTKKAYGITKSLQSKVNSDSNACMLFTSGTTSRSKGVLLTHNNIINSALATIHHMQWTKDDRMCVTVPMFHCFGVTSSLLTTILLGSTMCILPYYKTIDVLNCIQKHQCTIINGVPSMFLAMLRNEHFKEYDLSSLKSGIVAGSPLPPEDYLTICSQIPSLKLIPSYGQTETSPAVTFSLSSDPDEKRALSVGKAIEGVEIQIVDNESGSLLPVGESGEIMVRGYNVMQGYYNMPDETKQALTPDGWLRTGDMGFFDGEGYLHINGRKKDIIIRAGENISPHEIEDYIIKIPWIEQVVVIGVPAEVIQEEIVGCVVLKKGETLHQEYIRQYLASRIAHYKIPVRFLEFQEFPMNSSGKIKLAEIKSIAIKRLNQSDK